jgi:hypothetical protein
LLVDSNDSIGHSDIDPGPQAVYLLDDFRVATRYDKLAANYIAVVQLASIRRWLAAR